MSETVTVDGPPAAKGPPTVSASALALHLNCTSTYEGKLEAEGMIQRQVRAPSAMPRKAEVRPPSR